MSVRIVMILILVGLAGASQEPAVADWDVSSITYTYGNTDNEDTYI